MNTQILNIAPGAKVIFTLTGKQFQIVKVTDKKVSWNAPASYKGGTGKNRLTMVCVSLQKFIEGVEKGSYKIL